MSLGYSLAFLLYELFINKLLSVCDCYVKDEVTKSE